MQKYSAKGLSDIAGVSVRTLHYYDKIGLLKPAIRTEAKYRLYGESELLKLQQILFFKELGFTLEKIRDVLNNPEFDLIQTLESHSQALVSKQHRISQMLNTIEKTLLKLKGKKMITENELYEGFTKEEVRKNRKDTVEKYGKEVLEKSETYLKKLSINQFEELKREQSEIFKALFEISNRNPQSQEVQLEIARHYKNIRRFWGTDGSGDPQWKEYKGLGQLYVADERFTEIEGKAQPDFALFLAEAMTHFAHTQLR